MNRRADGLNLAHAFPQMDFLLGKAEIAVHVFLHGFDYDGNGRAALDCFHENLIILHAAHKRFR